LRPCRDIYVILSTNSILASAVGPDDDDGMPTRTILSVVLLLCASPTLAGVLDRQKLLEAQTFWDNRDFDWYQANIPFLDTPDADINTTWYYRWEVVTKHLTYGSPNSGYSFTEFIDRPFWSGRYGAISCPAGHQLYEVRWLRDPAYARDYARYWHRTPGAQPRNYSTWLADATWALHMVHPDDAYTKDLLADLIRNYEAWEKRQFVPEAGMFWQNGHDDGMEYNINSRQTKDILRGDRGYRPSFNAYMYADALAIANIAKLAGDQKTAEAYAKKAAALKENVQKKLWDPKRNFFFPMAARDEVDKDGHVVKAGSLTHQTGQFAGSEFGREEIGFVPWQFNMVDAGYESAWQFLMRRDRFMSDFGPTTVERRDPMFVLKNTCCWWSGMSWPYATTQTLVAMANLLNNYEQKVVTKDDYFAVLKTYTKTHRKDGKPYIAEAAHPDTGSWEGHDSPNHSEHYFHSAYCDLIVTGLIGVRPRADGILELNPLAPESWDYFALEGLPYKDNVLTIVWDRTGTRYNKGQGLTVFSGETKIASSPTLKKLSIAVPKQMRAPVRAGWVNFAVNNDGHYYPRPTATFTAPATSIPKAIDGHYWYHLKPANRWTTEGSPNATDSYAIDFGVKRPIDSVKLYFLDDGQGIVPPAKFELEHFDGQSWRPVPQQKRSPETPVGRRPNTITFPTLETTRLRATFTHASNAKTGLTEFEAWGNAALPLAPAEPPKGNLAFKAKATASFTSRFDKVEELTDGIAAFDPQPRNRWTAYESPNASDWVEVDLGGEKQVGRVELGIFDDRGGVRAPTMYTIEYWADGKFQPVASPKLTPERPAGGQWNEAKFMAVKTLKVRVVFQHRERAKSGVTEVLIWPE
jgi:hypothetical protein